jgi:hypothetical protein
MVYCIKYTERRKGMSRTTLALILVMLSAQTAQGANMRMCTDENGHKTFTQGACPDNTSRKSIVVQPAQSPVTAISASEKNMLNGANKRRPVTKKTTQKKKKRRRVRRRCGR